MAASNQSEGHVNFDAKTGREFTAAAGCDRRYQKRPGDWERDRDRTGVISSHERSVERRGTSYFVPECSRVFIGDLVSWVRCRSEMSELRYHVDLA